MKKTLAELIDELSVVNIKIFMLVEKVTYATDFTNEEAKKIQTLNMYRSKLKNAISEWANERTEVKV